MCGKYGIEISDEGIKKYKILLINMIYKLLPIREEGNDWQGYLDSVINEICGYGHLFEIFDEPFVVHLLSKLEGLRSLVNEQDFKLYRKIIFECTNLIE